MIGHRGARGGGTREHARSHSRRRWRPAPTWSSSTSATGLVLGHPGARPSAPARSRSTTALAYLAGTPIGIQLDLKIAGDRGTRSPRSSPATASASGSSSPRTRPASLRRLAHEAPELPARSATRATAPASPALPWPRRRRPRSPSPPSGRSLRARVPLLLSSARAGALCLHHALVSPGWSSRTVHARGRGARRLDGERAGPRRASSPARRRRDRQRRPRDGARRPGYTAGVNGVGKPRSPSGSA